jgi:hypothetical protein
MRRRGLARVSGRTDDAVKLFDRLLSHADSYLGSKYAGFRAWVCFPV